MNITQTFVNLHLTPETVDLYLIRRAIHAAKEDLVRIRTRSKENESRLFPSPFQKGFYILSLLRIHLTQIAQIYMNRPQPTTLVDLGCGDMPYRPLLRAYTDKYLGADLPENSAADLIITVGRPLDLADASVDYVLSSQVLEHVLDPTAYLQECWRILKPDGLLILSTHGHYQYHPHPTDLWRWTSAGLQKVITDQGFHIEEFRGLAGIGATSVSLLQYAFMQNVRLRSVQPLMSFILQHLMWLLDSLWRNPARDTDALVYLLVARKVNNHNAG